MRGSRLWPVGAAALAAALALGTSACGGSSAGAVHVGGKDRWSQSVSLDGGRLVIDAPRSDDASTRSRSEIVPLLLSSSANHTPTVVVEQTKLGRVTVLDDRRRVVDGFDHRLAWTVVYQSGPGATSWPAMSSSVTPPPAPPPGTFKGVQVFALTDDGTALQYSQPGSWFCGRPQQPTALPVVQRRSVPWRPGDQATKIVVTVPGCVAQPIAPLPVSRTEDGKPVLAVYAFGPFQPTRCTAMKSVSLTLSMAGLGHAPTVPVDCMHLAGHGPQFPQPDGCSLDRTAS